LGGRGGTRQQSAIGLRQRIGTRKRARAEHRERPGVWCLSGIDKGLFCNFATKSLKSGQREYYSYVVARSNARVVCIGLFAEDDAAYRHISLLFLHPISTHIDSYPPSSSTPYRHISTHILPLPPPHIDTYRHRIICIGLFSFDYLHRIICIGLFV
jgi:hypothetical protein